jgi:amino acid adenylation domain-containing protein
MKREIISTNKSFIAYEHEKEREYWLNKFTGDLKKAAFPYDHQKKSAAVTEREKQVGMVVFQFSPSLVSRLLELSNERDHRLHIILVAVLNIFIHKYSGANDIIVGVPIYKQEVEGEYINTLLAIRNQIHFDMSFKELLLQVRQTIVEASEHQNYPIETLLYKLNISSGGSDFPLSDVAILLENIHERKYLQPFHFNLVFTFSKTQEAIKGAVEYNRSLFERTTVERIVNQLSVLLQGVIFNINVTVSNVDILSQEDKKQLLGVFNDTDTEEDFPAVSTIHGLFEDMVKKYPDKTVVVDGDEFVTYRLLNEKANRLAWVLRAKGVGPGTVAAVMLENSVEMITGILGILKAGGIYFPIDVQYPVERIQYLLEDSYASFLLSRNQHLEERMFTALQGLHHMGLEPHMTGRRPQILDLDGLPIPDRSLVNYEKYGKYIGIAMFKNTVALQATRGCPYNCAYCHKIWPKQHVVRSAENIFAEVKRYYDIGVRRFSLIDDIFNLNRKNSACFFELLVKNGLVVQLFFPNGVRGDLLTKEYIDLMVEAGTINIALALETASPRLQKFIGKYLDLDKLKENLDYICAKYPLVILELFTMLGFPTETETEALMTLDFIKSLKWVDFPSINILKLYPNTDMEKLALENGISKAAIARSWNLAYHELPDTLPFDKSFTLKYQSDFFNEYFLSQERLLHLLPYEMDILTEDELVQKYHSYLPVEIKSFKDLLNFVNISENELRGGIHFQAEESLAIRGLNEKMKTSFPGKKPTPDALRILLLDLSQFFKGEIDMLYDMVEAPLGLMYLMTYLYQQFGSNVHGKIAKSRIDFDNFAELRTLVEAFKPDIIGIRTLTFFKNFFHRTTAMIRHWGIDVPIIAGGPYGTSGYASILQDKNIDLVVLGEGEITFSEIIQNMLKNGKKLPDEKVLKEIKGIAFIPNKERANKNHAREILLLEELTVALSRESVENPQWVNQSSDPAYIIFTSGSTGKPKGAVVEHKNVVSLMCNRRDFDFSSSDVWTMVHSCNFDFSVWEMYGALLMGGKLIPVSKMESIDPEVFLERLRKESVTILNQTPSAFCNLIQEELRNDQEDLRLRYIIFGGEALYPSRLKEWKQRYPHTRLINMYGITETTVHVTFKEIRERDIVQNISNIGKPIPRVTTYIMDQQLRLLPIGLPGELLVGGNGVGKGYLNRPELCVDRFIENPYKRGECLYRSGDLVRWLNNGEMEYLGRIDKQVKIRGYRIELGEIENELMRLKDVDDAVIIATQPAAQGVEGEETNELYLCAYVISIKQLEMSELRECLFKKLPDYMIPAFFMQIDSIPLTPNGKINYKALPEPKVVAGTKYILPGNKIERKLVAIWSEVLGIEDTIIGIDNNFFELGGHSLKATQLASRIHKEFNIKLPLVVLFKTPTIRGLSEYLQEAAEDKYPTIVPAVKKDVYPLSPAQKRMYILQQMDLQEPNYNITHAVLLEGELDRERLVKSIRQLIARHETLRTSIQVQVKGDEIVQKIYDEVEFNLQYFESGEDQAKQLIRQFIRPFDLSIAPFLRVALIKIENPKHVLVIDMHHIVTDYISDDIFIREFIAYYLGETLPGLKLQYKDFSEWQNNMLKSGQMKKQEEYWLDRFSNEIPGLQLPFDYPRPVPQNFDGEIIRFAIDHQLTDKVKQFILENDVTLNILVLAVFNILLSKYSGQQDIVVGYPTIGRTNEDLQHIVGFFVNLLPMRNKPGENKSFSEFLIEVKNNAIEAFDNQDYPLEELVNKLSVRRDSIASSLYNSTILTKNETDLENRQLWDERLRKECNIRISQYPFDYTKIKYDLSFVAVESKDSIMLELKYATELFKKSTVEKILNRYVEILEQVIENKEIKLKDVKVSHELLVAVPDKIQSNFAF